MTAAGRWVKIGGVRALRAARALPGLGLAWVLGCAGLPAPPPPEPLAVELADDTVRELPPDKPGSSEVRFDSEPQGAELLVDNRLRGVTPLLIESLPPGRYKVEARKPGHRPFSDWIDHTGAGARYTLVLQPLVGRLALTVSPPGAEVTAGGRRVGPGVHQIAPGVYRVKARAFGYGDAERVVEVRADATASLDIALEAAQLSARLTGVSHRRFDPGVGGSPARVLVAWEATAPADATLRVVSQRGVEISTETGRSEGPRAEIAWDGRTTDGQAAEDGRYRLVLELRSSRGEQVSLEAPLIVARGSAPAPTAQWSAAAGLQYAPVPQAAAVRTGTFTFSSALVLDPGADEPVESAPVLAAARIGLAPALELDAAVGALLVEEPPLPLVATAAVKREIPLPAGPLSAAVLARASLQSGSGSDPFMAFTGLGVGLPVAAALGPVLLVACPEVTASPWRVTGDDAYDENPRLNVWAYLRAGAAARLAALTVGVSAAVRTAPFADGLAVDEPLAVAVEAHWSPPASRLLLTLWAGAELGGWALERALAGAAFAYLY